MGACVLGTRLGSGCVCSGCKTWEWVRVFLVRDLGVGACVLGMRLGSGRILIVAMYTCKVRLLRFCLAEEIWLVYMYVVTDLTCSSLQALQALFQPLQGGQSIKVKEIMTEEVTQVSPPPYLTYLPLLISLTFLSSSLLIYPKLFSPLLTLSAPLPPRPSLLISPHIRTPTLYSPSSNSHTLLSLHTPSHPLPPHTHTPLPPHHHTLLFLLHMPLNLSFPSRLLSSSSLTNIHSPQNLVSDTHSATMSSFVT